MEKATRIFTVSALCLILIISFSSYSKAGSSALLINEIYYDVDKDYGAEGTNEWIEIYNPSDSDVDMSDWVLEDNKTTTPLPAITIPTNGFALITKEESTWDFWTIPGGVTKIVLGKKIGNGLANSGDRLILKDNNDKEVDKISYGKDTSILDPALPDVKEGHTLERSPFGLDTDTASDFIDQKNPTPGSGYTPPTYSDNIIINEILSNPEGSDDNEYLELYNDDAEDVDLQEWKIADKTSTKTIGDKIILDSYTIAGRGFLVIYKKDGSVTLNNDGDTIRLLNPNGKLVEEITYPSMSEGTAYAKTTEGIWKETALPTPNAENQFPTLSNEAKSSEEVKEYPENIYINEVMANPDTGSEWVELFNNNPVAVTLDNWQLDDIEGGSSPQTFSTTIQAYSYVVIYLKSNKLNNSGDKVRLIRPDGSIADEVSYTSSTKGYSYAKDTEGDWKETSLPTPGTENQFDKPQEAPTSSGEDAPKEINEIQNIKRLKLGTKVKVRAWVTAEPEILGKKVMYIEDKTDGIKVRLDGEDYSDVSLGDYIELACTIEESRSEYYIKMDDDSSLEILEKEQDEIEPTVIKTELAGELYEGRLVRLSGEVVETSGDTFFLDDGSGKVKIYIKDSTEIDKPATPKGTNVQVIGIVSQYGDNRDGTANFRVMPRYQEDIQIIDNETSLENTIAGSVLGLSTLKELPKTGSGPYHPIILMLIVGVVLRFYPYRKGLPN